MKRLSEIFPYFRELRNRRERWQLRNGLRPNLSLPGIVHQGWGWYDGLSSPLAAAFLLGTILFIAATATYIVGASSWVSMTRFAAAAAPLPSPTAVVIAGQPAAVTLQPTDIPATAMPPTQTASPTATPEPTAEPTTVPTTVIPATATARPPTAAPTAGPAVQPTAPPPVPTSVPTAVPQAPAREVTAQSTATTVRPPSTPQGTVTTPAGTAAAPTTGAATSPQVTVATVIAATAAPVSTEDPARSRLTPVGTAIIPLAPTLAAPTAPPVTGPTVAPLPTAARASSNAP